MNNTKEHNSTPIKKTEHNNDTVSSDQIITNENVIREAGDITQLKKREFDDFNYGNSDFSKQEDYQNLRQMPQSIQSNFKMKYQHNNLESSQFKNDVKESEDYFSALNSPQKEYADEKSEMNLVISLGNGDEILVPLVDCGPNKVILKRKFDYENVSKLTNEFSTRNSQMDENGYKEFIRIIQGFRFVGSTFDEGEVNNQPISRNSELQEPVIESINTGEIVKNVLECGTSDGDNHLEEMIELQELEYRVALAIKGDIDKKDARKLASRRQKKVKDSKIIDDVVQVNSDESVDTLMRKFDEGPYPDKKPKKRNIKNSRIIDEDEDLQEILQDFPDLDDIKSVKSHRSLKNSASKIDRNANNQYAEDDPLENFFIIVDDDSKISQIDTNTQQTAQLCGSLDKNAHQMITTKDNECQIVNSITKIRKIIFGQKTHKTFGKFADICDILITNDDKDLFIADKSDKKVYQYVLNYRKDLEKIHEHTINYANDKNLLHIVMKLTSDNKYLFVKGLDGKKYIKQIDIQNGQVVQVYNYELSAEDISSLAENNDYNNMNYLKGYLPEMDITNNNKYLFVSANEYINQYDINQRKLLVSHNFFFQDQNTSSLKVINTVLTKDSKYLCVHYGYYKDITTNDASRVKIYASDAKDPNIKHYQAQYDIETFELLDTMFFDVDDSVNYEHRKDYGSTVLDEKLSVFSLKVSDNDKYLFLMSNKKIYQYGIHERRLIHIYTNNMIHKSIVLSKDSKYLYIYNIKRVTRNNGKIDLVVELKQVELDNQRILSHGELSWEFRSNRYVVSF